MASVFTFEQRTCVRCGEQFDALDFWEADVPCDTCGMALYEERVRGINEAKPYSVDSIGGMCPTQADGLTPGGRPYYFRARHGRWTLDVGQPGWPVGLLDWPGDGEQVAAGDDPSHGSMTDDEVLVILDEHLTAQ